MRSHSDRSIGRARRPGQVAWRIAARVVVGLMTTLGGVTVLSSTAGAMQPAQFPIVRLGLPGAPDAPAIAAASVPYAVGEALTYRATFGGIPAGTARMRVDGIELVRGRPAYHVVFTVDGGVPFFRYTIATRAGSMSRRSRRFGIVSRSRKAGIKGRRRTRSIPSGPSIRRRVTRCVRA